MKIVKTALALVLLLTSLSLTAWAATTYYRPCCIDEPERHGCAISGWYTSQDDANRAGARHAQKTSGHSWQIEETTR